MVGQDQASRSHNFQDLSGKFFGRWTVLRRHHDGKRGSARWLCRCDCGTERVVDGYSLRSGLSTSCRCLITEKNRSRIGVKHHNWRGGRRACRMRDAYGIEKDEYEEQLARQNGVCAICKNLEVARRKGIRKPLSVDHDHKSGAFRGLLCTKCNTALGLLDEDREILLAAIEYLDRHTAAETS